MDKKSLRKCYRRYIKKYSIAYLCISFFLDFCSQGWHSPHARSIILSAVCHRDKVFLRTLFVLCRFFFFSGRRIVSMVYWAVSFPAAGAAADAVCCLLAEKKTHRDQLICTVINRKETFERSAKAKESNPGVLLFKRSPLDKDLLFD